MKYYSEFADINGVEYQVTIETSSGSGTTNFTLGGNPFVTEMESEEKHLYSPIKTIGATVTMVTDQIPFDIYSGSALGTKVTLTSEGKTKWVGFVSPCVFDMGFDNDIEELEIECVDGIAVLKDLQYQDDTHDITEFAQILFKCLKRPGVFKSFYISDNVQLTSNGNDSIIDQLRISQQNFFDEKDDINQTDDDIAWSCYDVLYEICQYLGYTIYADGDEVYIIDYDAIKAGINTYYKYSIEGDQMSPPVDVTLSYSSYIDGDSYAENGTKISLDEIYNKITVVDNFYTYDSLFPEFGDEAYETNVTADADAILDAIREGGSGDFSGIDSTLRDCYDFPADTFNTNMGAQDTYQIFISKSWNNRYWIIVFRIFDSPVFEFKKYDSVTDEDVTNKWTNWKFGDLLSVQASYNDKTIVYNPINGSFYTKMYKREIKRKDYNNWRAKYPSDWDSQTYEEKIYAWADLLNTNPETISVDPVIVCLNRKDTEFSNHIGPGGIKRTGSYSTTDEEDCLLYPYIRLKGDRNSSIFGGRNSYILIQGTFRYHDKVETPYPLANGADSDDLRREGDLKDGDQGFIWARLKWGSMYWTGDDWSDEECDFKIPFWDENASRNDRKNNSTYDYDFDFMNTARLTFNVNEDGYYIPAPTSGNLNGTADLIFYCNRDMYGYSRRGNWNPSNGNKYSRYYSNCVFLTNLSVKAAYSTGLLNEDVEDSDTAYTNVIDNGAVDAMDDIEFKICTFDYKDPSYSSVDYISNNSSVYVASTYNKALTKDEESTEGTDGITGALRQEEHYVYKLATQYAEPRIILEANLHNDDYKMYGAYTDKTLSGKTFVIQEISTDYKMNQQNIKFLEKA